MDLLSSIEEMDFMGTLVGNVVDDYWEMTGLHLQARVWLEEPMGWASSCDDIQD